MPSAIRPITASVLALSALASPILAEEDVQQVLPMRSLLHGHDRTFSFTYSLNGEFFITWDAVTRRPDASIAVWRVSDWQLLTRKNLRTGLSVRVELRSGSSMLVSSHVLHPRGGKKQHYRLSLPELEGVKIERAPISDVVSADGNLRVSRPITPEGELSRTAIEIRSVVSHELVFEFEPYRGYTRAYEFSPDSRYLAYSGRNHTHLRGTYKDATPPEVLAERKVEPPFRLWDVVENREFRHAVRGNWRWRFLRFTSDSTKVILQTAEEILVMDFRTGELSARHTVQGVQRPRISADGSLVLMHKDKQAVLWDHAEGRHTVWKCHDAIGPKKNFLFAPDSRAIVTRGCDGTLLIWSVEELLSFATPSTF